MLNLLRHFRNLILLFCFLLIGWFLLSQVKMPSKIQYGVTFSLVQARDLGLNWQEVYLSMLEDLGVKKIRLPAYWDELETSQGVFNWQDLDWQLAEAKKQQAEVVLAVGGRLPRWPECHFPNWTNSLVKKEREQKTIDYIRQVVKRYRAESAITAWQVENEPFLSNFGECPELDSAFLDQEIALVRSLDTRPIIVTDSGELSFWVLAAKRADIFGTTMYRDTYSKALKQYIHYPITPTFFKVKKNLADFFASPKKWIVIELQAEPWSKEAFQNVSETERDRTMSPQKFDEIMTFAQATGFDELYLWGVEWWYWEKTIHNRRIFWEKAKLLYNNQ